MEVARTVMEFQRADLNPKHNAGKYDELTSQLYQMDDQLAVHDAKTAFIQGRIDALRQPDHEGDQA